MGDVDDYDFSAADAGASKTYPMEAGQIRVGGFMVQKDIHPCKVSAISTSKTGKHGSAKCNITAIDIFTGKKYESINPSSETAQIPFVIRKEYSLVDISGDGFTTLMDEEGNCREDVTLPEWPDNFAREIENAFGTGKPHSVTVLTAMGHDQIVSIKEDQEGKA